MTPESSSGRIADRPRLFSRRIPPVPQQWKRAEPDLAAIRPHFDTEKGARDFLSFPIVGPEGRWAYMPSGKTGTTSALQGLFELEFGVPLATRIAAHDNLNRDQAVHRLTQAGVFLRLAEVPGRKGPLAMLDDTVRLATVRHPLARAISGFRYLCRSHAEASPQFQVERLRLAARTGFDWDRHPETAEGLVRFLDHLAAEIAEDGVEAMDRHFRPQVANVRPDLFRPDITGRTEDLPRFFARIASRLGKPVPAPSASRPLNVQGAPPDTMVAEPSVRRRVLDLFAADFEAFGYEIDSPLHTDTAT